MRGRHLSGLAVATLILACTPQGQRAAIELFSRKASCMFERSAEGYSLVDAGKRCAVEPADLRSYLEIFSAGQRVGARARAGTLSTDSDAGAP